MKMVAGTARSMGLNVKGKAPWVKLKNLTDDTLKK